MAVPTDLPNQPAPIADAEWDQVLRPKNKWYQVDVKGVWKYRDLLMLFVRRDFAALYKQSILGPLWIVIQPLLTATLLAIVFSYIAKIPTSGAPAGLFYLCGYIPWTYFSDSFLRTSSTFTANASIFGKVYFPRLVTPISAIISSMMRFFVQLVMLAGIYLVFVARGATVTPTIYLVFLPVLLLMMAGFALSFGLIISALTTRYRDIQFMVAFLLQVGMYSSSVVFPYSWFANHQTLQQILKYNPMLWIIEAFKHALLGVGQWNWLGLAYAAGVMIVLLFIAVITFGRVEKTFMDTV